MHVRLPPATSWVWGLKENAWRTAHSLYGKQGKGGSDRHHHHNPALSIGQVGK